MVRSKEDMEVSFAKDKLRGLKERAARTRSVLWQQEKDVRAAKERVRLTQAQVTMPEGGPGEDV